MFRGISLIYLPYSNLDFSLTIWAIFFGLDFIATVPPTVKLTSKYFVQYKVQFYLVGFFSASIWCSIRCLWCWSSKRFSVNIFASIVWAGFASFMATILILIFKRLTFNYQFKYEKGNTISGLIKNTYVSFAKITNKCI